MVWRVVREMDDFGEEWLYRIEDVSERRVDPWSGQIIHPFVDRGGKPARQSVKELKKHYQEIMSAFKLPVLTFYHDNPWDRLKEEK